VIVGDRFMIEADGQAANIDELKAAVATVDQDGLVTAVASGSSDITASSGGTSGSVTVTVGM
jgi:hypothetical protein